MEFIFIVIFIVLIGLFGFCIFGLVCSIKSTAKRRKLQGQADYSFETSNGNYHFYYSTKSIKNEKGIFVKIFTEPVLGFSDLAHADTNKFIEFKISINDSELLTKVEKKGLTAMGEVEIPSEYIVDNDIKANFTIKTFWCLGGEQIEDTLTFVYGE